MKKILLILTLSSLSSFVEAKDHAQKYQSIFDDDLITGYFVGVDSYYQDFDGTGTWLASAKVGFGIVDDFALELSYHNSIKAISFADIDTAINKYQINTSYLSRNERVLHLNGGFKMGLGQLKNSMMSDDYIYFGADLALVTNLAKNVKMTFNFGFEISNGLAYEDKTDANIGRITGGIGFIYGVY